MRGSILIAGEFWFGASAAGLAHGFRGLGWEVVEVDLREHVLSRNTPVLRLAGRILNVQFAKSYNAAILREAENCRPKVFLTIKGSLVLPQTLTALRRMGIISVNYYPDYHFNYAGLNPASLFEYDYFFTTKSFQLDYLRRQLGKDRVRFLHHGYSSLVHRPRSCVDGEAHYDTDIAYIGNASSYKEAWLSEVIHRLGSLKLTVVGNGWPNSLKGQNVNLIEHHALGDRYATMIQKARINIAIHSGAEEKTGWQDLVSTRTFEIPACKGFMLHIDNPEIRTLFEPAKEIDVFADVDDLVRKARYYLSVPDRRAQMIERAYSRCVPAYSYDSRAAAMLTELTPPVGSRVSTL